MEHSVGGFEGGDIGFEGGDIGFEGGDIGGFEGGGLERPRPWLGAQRAGRLLGVPSCPGPPGAPSRGTGAELGRCQDGALARLIRACCRAYSPPARVGRADPRG